MSNVKIDTKTIKYADGTKMSRISFEVPASKGKAFRKIVKRKDEKLASIFRPVVDMYIAEDKVLDAYDKSQKSKRV